MKGVFRRVGMTMVPVQHDARAAIEAIPDGKLCMGEFWAARNPLHHDLFWSLCRLVGDAEDMAPEPIKDMVMRALGRGEMLILADSTARFVPESIAYESMPQAEFKEFFDQAVEVLAARLGTTKPELLDQFNELVKGRQG